MKNKEILILIVALIISGSIVYFLSGFLFQNITNNDNLGETVPPNETVSNNPNSDDNDNKNPTSELTISEETKPEKEVEIEVKSDHNFYCEIKPDTKFGGEVYTVMYSNEKGTKPWLKMVRSMGESWNTKARCEEISQRLEIFKDQDLIGFNYRRDLNTPSQYVLCAKLKNNNGCPLVLTLHPDDDPEVEIKEVTSALINGNPASYQSSGELTPENPAFISIEGLL